MSKISEELIKLSSKPAGVGTHRRNIKLPSYALKSETPAEAKTINNVISIDSLKNNRSRTHKRTLCLNLGNNLSQPSTPIVENCESTIKSFVENINSVVENFESKVKPIPEITTPIFDFSKPTVENSVSPVSETSEPVVENVNPAVESISPVVETCEPAVESVNPFVQTYFEHFESPIEEVAKDVDTFDQHLESLSADSNDDSSRNELTNSILESPITTSEPKIEEKIDINQKPVINLGSPFFYTPSVFKQYDITISNADGAEEDVNAEAKRILEEIINASKNKIIAKATPANKKVSTDKKNVAKSEPTKKVVAKKKAVAKSETTEKVVEKKKVTAKKKAVAKSEPTEKVVAKKKVTTQAEPSTKKVATKKKAVPQEKTVVKKVTTKKAIPQQEKVAVKKVIVKEKPVAEKATTKKVIKKVVVKNEVKTTKPVEKKSTVSENKTVKIKPTIIEPIVENKKPASIITVKPVKIKVSAKSKELETKKDFVDLDALISQDTVNEAYLESINNINTTQQIVNNIVVTEPVVPAKPIIKETVSPIVEPVVKESASPVGILVETPSVKTNKKINTPKASTFNSIFKKFSYDEAELMNSTNALVDESPSIQAINKIPEVGQTLENVKIGQDKNVTELNVQASPISTIPVLENDVEVITAIEPSSNYNSENDINILNVLTPQNNVYNSVEPIVTIEDLLTLNPDIKHTVKADKPTQSDSADVESSVEEIETDEIVDTIDTDDNEFSIEEIEIEEIVDTIDTDDNEFSIENYFNLGNDVSDSEENEVLNYDDTVGEELIDDNADIEFETKAEKNSPENEQNIIDEIIKELDEEFVFEDLQDYELEEQNEDIIIEDNNYKLVEDSIFDNMLNDISLDDIDLEDLSSLTIADVISEKDEESSLDDDEIVDNSDEDIIDENDIDIEDLLSEDIEISDIIENENTVEGIDENDIQDENTVEVIDENDIHDENSIEEINESDIDIEDLLEDNIEIDDVIEENKDIEIDEDELEESELKESDEESEISSLSDYVSNDASTSENEIESILEYAMSSSPNISNTDLKEKLLTELFGTNIDAVSDKATLNINGVHKDVTSDFLKVIDTLTQAISKLEQKNTQPDHLVDELGKSINIEIDKDDIFSISILNETYEIVADFDGISVLSENIHISTPKNNFFVKIGDKYIEIHNQKTNFVVYTNFEDVEFSNALNNVAFTKKNNRIELTIKEAFKLSSGNNKILLSMLNTSIADIEKSQTSSNENEESSVCDNKTLVISEETQKVYLPYTIKDIMEKLSDTSTGYQTVQEVIHEEYILPLSEFKMPIVSRFKEAYRFMREKEKSSVYAAIDLALELMFNTTLNPAVIRACKNLRELNIYLDCLYENELEKFDCFKVIYKVLPKIQ